ncbi:uncharacterized protein LOC131064352 [Cryptomeria japonica]|uniref:uncharacterized protein LOC131064352 n=1 Tax=Cryptomeria japonica TaxID=3369 RepID=UPI0025AB62DD|nr:uncharacterized protein LOC131064352 [Cryptomeria japonica]
MGSAYDEFSNLSRSENHREILLGKGCEYDKYLRSLVVMQGENPAGAWIANRKSIQEIKEQMKKGEEEGKNCSELISLLKTNSSPDFCAERCVRLQIGLLTRVELGRELDVERELNVHKCSRKMTVVSIIAVIIELSSFIQDQVDADNMVDSIMEACSQAWNIMDIIEISDNEAVELSNTANILFQNLHKTHKWLDYNLPTSRTMERAPATVKEAMESLFEKGKQISNDYQSKKWSETVAGFSLYKLGVYMNYQSTNAEVILNKLHGMLADVIGSCTVKAVGVLMEDCKKQASLYEEKNILKIAGVAGKVKGLTENLGWKLKWIVDEETQSLQTILARDQVPAIQKYATFQMR